MKPFRYISEIEIDNMGTRGIRVRGRQGGADFDMRIPISGEVQSLLSYFEEGLVRFLEDQKPARAPGAARRKGEEQLELSGVLNS